MERKGYLFPKNIIDRFAKKPHDSPYLRSYDKRPSWFKYGAQEYYGNEVGHYVSQTEQMDQRSLSYQLKELRAELSNPEIEDYATKASMYKAIQEQLLQANLRLAITCAGDTKYFELPFMDKVQEGNIGMMKALNTYDPDKGKLAQYLYRGAFMYIKRASRKHARVISLPVHIAEWTHKIFATISEIAEESDRDPSQVDYSEVAERLGKSTKTIKKLLAYNEVPLSLDVPTGMRNENFGDTIKDEYLSTEDTAFRNIQSVEILKILQEYLSPVQFRQFVLYYGYELTFEEIGEICGVTKQSVQVTVGRALSNVKKKEANSPRLREYFDD